MGTDENGYIPKSLDAQERFLWWEMDQAVIAIMLISMGVISGSMLMGIALDEMLSRFSKQNLPD